MNINSTESNKEEREETIMAENEKNGGTPELENVVPNSSEEIEESVENIVTETLEDTEQQTQQLVPQKSVVAEPSQKNSFTYVPDQIDCPDKKPKKKIFKIVKIAFEVIVTLCAIIFLITINYDIENETKLIKKYDSLQSKYNAKDEAFKALQTDFDSYKEKMKPYEEMELEEVKAKKIADEKAISDKKAAEEQAAAEAAAAKAAEEAKGYETGITYDQLARTPDDFTGKKVKFHGKVVQVMEDTSSIQIRLAVDDNYDTILLGEYISSAVSSRVLEDDYITIYGSSAGTISYQSTIGGTITVPGVIIDKIDQ